MLSAFSHMTARDREATIAITGETPKMIGPALKLSLR